MKTVLLLSGGMDSTTLLYYLLNKGHEVYCLSFDYNQKHKKELLAAQEITRLTNTPHKVVDITGIHELINESSLTSNKPVPKGHYEDKSMQSTVVPNRNMILLSLAIAYAVNIGADKVAYAAHSGDHAIYPDCRPEFFFKMNEVSKISNYNSVQVIAPFLKIDKIAIAEIGLRLQVPFNKTWTCYEGKDKPCGKCGACTERKEALKTAEGHI